MTNRRPLASPYEYCWFHGWTNDGHAIVEKPDGTVTLVYHMNITFADAPDVDQSLVGAWPKWWAAQEVS